MNDKKNTLGIFTESIAQVACPNCNAELDVSEFAVFEDIVCPVCQEPIKVPGRLGDFILIEELGRGAMGCVYLAMDESLNRLVALKVIRKEYGEDPKMLETVQREAQAMATLNHRNIVQVYSFGRVRDQPYFVMELLQGERLDEMMAGGKPIPEIRAMEIALDVAQGLDAANQAGLTHGDIKPANILMNEQGVAKVVDFGLAKFMEPGAEIEVWGTPYYIAPEKARKKGEDSRSDQYSLGGTIFHALAGHPPFDGPTPTKVVVAALKEDTPVLKEHNPTVTEKTSAVILRMMDKNPARRYPTYASLLADLEVALKEARDAERKREEDARRLREKQNKKISPLVWILAICTLLAVAGVSVGVWLHSRQPAAPAGPRYEGPVRQLHEPFTVAELRNLREAVAALGQGDYTLANEKLEVAGRLIPEQHAARGWLRFFEAGIRLYAQYPEEARAALEAVADRADMVFDADRSPSEDPRLLAAFALGRIDERELERSLRRPEAYMSHLSELARGYRLVLADDRNSSARHFRSYAEFPDRPPSWVYLLQPIARQLHLPLEKLFTRAQEKEALEARATEMMADLGLRDTEGRPFFRVCFIRDGNHPVLDNLKNPQWTQSPVGPAARITADNLLANAGGVQVLPGRAFTLATQLTPPAASQREDGKPDVIFHLGGFLKEGELNPLESLVVKGVVLEMPPADGGPPSLRLRMGDGVNSFTAQTFPAPGLLPGAPRMVSLSWDGYRVDGSRPANRLSVAVDGVEVGFLDLPEGPFPPVEELNLVAVGTGIGSGGKVGWGSGRISLQSFHVFSGAKSAEELQVIRSRIIR